MHLPVTVGMEEYQIRPAVILVVAIPVMQFEGLPALDHLSADGTHSGLLVQDLRTKYRGCPQGSLSIVVGEVRLPLRIDRVGVALDLDVALRCNRLLHPDDLEPPRWIGEPPGCPRLMGEVTGSDPPAGVIRVSLLGPSIEPSPDHTVPLGEGFGTQNVSRIIGPTPPHGIEPLDELSRGGPDSLLTQGLHRRFDAWETAFAGCYLQLGRFAITAGRLTPGLPKEVKPVGDGRNDSLFRRQPAAALGSKGGDPGQDRVC
jgi:hypothetical protein